MLAASFGLKAHGAEVTIERTDRFLCLIQFARKLIEPGNLKHLL